MECKNRGPCERFTAEEKAQIGKRAAEHGVAATVPVLLEKVPWARGQRQQRSNMEKQIPGGIEEEKRVREGNGRERATKLKESVRFYYITEELDQQVQAYLL